MFCRFNIWNQKVIVIISIIRLLTKKAVLLYTIINIPSFYSEKSCHPRASKLYERTLNKLFSTLFQISQSNSKQWIHLVKWFKVVRLCCFKFKDNVALLMFGEHNNYYTFYLDEFCLHNYHRKNHNPWRSDGQRRYQMSKDLFRASLLFYLFFARLFLRLFYHNARFRLFTWIPTLTWYRIWGNDLFRS